MELYVSGVKVPKLGSSKDIVLRQYLVHKAGKEVTRNKILVQAAIIQASQNKEVATDMIADWNKFVNMELYLEEHKAELEMDMKEEYEYWKNVKPQIVKDDKGGLSVKGIHLPQTTKTG